MLASTFFLLGAMAFGQTPPRASFSERIEITAGTVVAKLPSSQATLEDLKLYLNDELARVLEVRPVFSGTAEAQVHSPDTTAGSAQAGPEAAAPAVEVAVVVLTDFCDRYCRSYGAELVLQEAAKLLRMGPVRVVQTGQVSRILGEGLRDEASLRQALEGIPLLQTRNVMIWERKQIWEIEAAAARQGVLSSGWDFFMVRRALRQMVAALETGRAAPVTVAFVLSDGFDISPFEGLSFQQAASAKFERQPWEQRSPQWWLDREKDSEDTLRLLARGLAAEGIVLHFVYPGIGGQGGQYYGSSAGGGSLFEEFMTVGYNLSLWSRYSFTPLAQPTRGMGQLAAETGGSLVYSKKPLGVALEGLKNLFLVTYQVSGVLDGRLVPVKLFFRGAEVPTVSPVTRLGVSSLASEARAVAALTGPSSRGALGVTIHLADVRAAGKKTRQGLLVARTDVGHLFETLKDLARGRFRVTVAVELAKEEPFVHQEEFVQEVKEGAGTVWTYEAPIRLPKEAERISVLVEELQTGAWGIAVVEVPPKGR